MKYQIYFKKMAPNTSAQIFFDTNTNSKGGYKIFFLKTFRKAVWKQWTKVPITDYIIEHVLAIKDIKNITKGLNFGDRNNNKLYCGLPVQAFTTELDIIRHSKKKTKPNQDNIIDDSEHDTNDINN